MNEPKRSGRQPKRVNLAEEVMTFEGTFDRAPYFSGESPSQAYAMRVWNGQSVDVPRSERIARVIKALEGQSLPTEGIDLP